MSKKKINHPYMVMFIKSMRMDIEFFQADNNEVCQQLTNIMSNALDNISSIWAKCLSLSNKDDYDHEDKTKFHKHIIEINELANKCMDDIWKLKPTTKSWLTTVIEEDLFYSYALLLKSFATINFFYTISPHFPHHLTPEFAGDIMMIELNMMGMFDPTEEDERYNNDDQE